MKRKRSPVQRTIELSSLAVEKLWRLVDGVPLSTTFVPQADDLDLAYELVRSRLPDVVSSHDLSQAFKLHGRHAAYTLEAMSELGFLDRFSTGWFSRSILGAEIASATEAAAYRIFIRAVLRLPVIRRVLAEFRSRPGGRVPREAVNSIIVAVSNQRYSGVTVGRRATTVIAWMLWLENDVWFCST